jgi:hypothetical protein
MDGWMEERRALTVTGIDTGCNADGLNGHNGMSSSAKHIDGQG